MRILDWLTCDLYRPLGISLFFSELENNKTCGFSSEFLNSLKPFRPEQFEGTVIKDRLGRILGTAVNTRMTKLGWEADIQKGDNLLSSRVNWCNFSNYLAGKV